MYGHINILAPFIAANLTNAEAFYINKICLNDCRYHLLKVPAILWIALFILIIS